MFEFNRRVNHLKRGQSQRKQASDNHLHAVRVGLRLFRLSPAFVILALVFSQAGLGLAQNINLRTYVDRTNLAVGQQFVLTIEASGSDAQSAPAAALPDLSTFADYVGSSTSQNFQIVNGRMSVSKSSTNFYVARVAGKYQIPAISILFRGNTISSQPIDIEIVAGAAPPATTPGQQPGQPSQSQTPQSQIVPESSLEGNLFLQAEVDRRSVYQNQPVNIVYKIYTRVEVTNYAISQLPNMQGFWSEEYAMPPQPLTYEKVIDGKKILVAEIKKLALFPTDAGEKTIEPMAIDCEVRIQDRRRSRDIFDEFFTDDFFGNSMLGRRVRAKIASKPIKIEVKPLPVVGRPADFSGAVGDLTMTAALDKDQVAANEAVTLKIQYTGKGNIKMLPEPKPDFPPGIEIYEPKVNQDINRNGSTIQGSKTIEYVLIPRLAGEHRIKPITFSYFNPATESYQTQRSPEFLLKVTSSGGSGLPFSGGLSREEVKFIGRDIRFIKQESEPFHRIDAYFYRTFWFGLLLVLPLLVLGGALWYRQKQGKMAENVAYARSRRANQLAKKRLSRAHKLIDTATQKEFYAETSRALLGFVADRLNLATAGLMTDDVATRLRERQVDEEVITRLLSCVQECDYQRFAPANSTVEDMAGLYERARAAIIDLDRAKLN